VDKVFEAVTSVTFADVDLACRSIQLHYPPDKIVKGIGIRTLVTNHDPGTVVAMLVLDSLGLLELTKRMLANRGRALTGTLTIVAKDGTHVFRNACTLNGPDASGRCEFDISRDD
jgi:hypothetical protein